MYIKQINKKMEEVYLNNFQNRVAYLHKKRRLVHISKIREIRVQQYTQNINNQNQEENMINLTSK